MAKFKHHAQEILKVNPGMPEWQKMILCGFATTIPLLIGLYRQEMSFALFGALTGFVLTFNDHWGDLKHRIWTLSLTVLILQFALMLGIAVQDQYILQVWVLTYWTGLMAGHGAELERAMLFAVFQFLAISMLKLPMEALPIVTVYGAVGYAGTVALMILLQWFLPKPPASYKGTRESLKHSITLNFQRHFYATFYATVILLTLLFVQSIHLGRGYWAVGTAVLIMRPDHRLTIYRGFQRLIGTVIGVFAVEALIYIVHDMRPIIGLILLLSFLTPWFLARSYWVATGLITVMVLLLLDLPHVSEGDLMTPILRLQATAIGCGMAILGVAIVNAVFKSLRKSF